jgi:hypothetical protein
VKPTAAGFSVHSGWTALVALSLDKESPAVLHRERLRLVEDFTYRLRQPYHTVQKMPLAEARRFIAKVRTTAANLAHRAIRTLRKQLEQHGYDLTRAALLVASGKSLPELEKILASHALIHAADGELFREALAEASAQCDLRLFRLREKELLDQAAQTLEQSHAAVLQQAKELGRPFGSPWSRDEKFATLAAWLALRKRA